jgi:hypothetical protein
MSSTLKSTITQTATTGTGGSTATNASIRDRVGVNNGGGVRLNYIIVEVGGNLFTGNVVSGKYSLANWSGMGMEELTLHRLNDGCKVSLGTSEDGADY